MKKENKFEALLEHLPIEQEDSFFAKAFDLPYFGTPWHYHPEFELVLVAKSSGKRFVGNSVSEFQDGDLSFLGPNLPHLYKNSSPYYENNPDMRAHSIVIHFLDTSIGKDFLNLPQSRKIQKLFDNARQGLDILGNTKITVTKKMKELLHDHGMNRLIRLLDILNILAESDEYKLISSPGIVGHNPLDTERLDKIFQHILRHFQQEISLEEIANLVYMTRTSFCRFFKERTKRNFFSFLMDVRLEHAAKLLVESKTSIVDISLSCGYNNLSNFNRQFKDKFKISPRAYRQTFFI